MPATTPHASQSRQPSADPRRGKKKKKVTVARLSSVRPSPAAGASRRPRRLGTFGPGQWARSSTATKIPAQCAGLSQMVKRRAARLGARIRLFCLLMD